MDTLITVLAVVASIVLVLIVLVQNSKGGGLSANFSSSNQIMGVRKTTDFLEKATWGLAAFIMVLSITSAVLKRNESTGTQSDIKVQTAAPANNTTSPDVSLPQQGTPKQAQPQQAAQPGKPAFPAKPAAK